MEIKTINSLDKAKQFLDKNVYSFDYFSWDRERKISIEKFYIKGITLVYNFIDYEITHFGLYYDKNGKKKYGDVEAWTLFEEFDKSEPQIRKHICYFTRKEEAEEYTTWYTRTDQQKEKEKAIDNAKEILDKVNVKYTIFD